MRPAELFDLIIYSISVNRIESIENGEATPALLRFSYDGREYLLGEMVNSDGRSCLTLSCGLELDNPQEIDAALKKCPYLQSSIGELIPSERQWFEEIADDLRLPASFPETNILLKIREVWEDIRIELLAERIMNETETYAS
jgi:hypothetical protein